MIKLKDILTERDKPQGPAMPKNRWMQLSGSELDKYKKDILKLIKTAYKPIGGHANYKTVADISLDGLQVWHAVDLDNDPEPDAVNIYKKKKHGMKSTGLGHDGSKPAKSSVIKNKIQQLKKSGWFVEVSGRMYDILSSSGVNIVDDEATVQKVLKGKNVTWHGDGWYSRKIGGVMHKKIMMGNPK